MGMHREIADLQSQGSINSKQRDRNNSNAYDSNSSNDHYQKQLALAVVGVAASLVPFGETGLLAAQGDYWGAFSSALTEIGGMAIGAATFGVGYAAYKSYKYYKAVKRAKRIADIRKQRQAADVTNRSLNSSNALEGVERASQSLIDAVSKKRTVNFAAEGSEEMRYLNYIGAEANVGGANMTHILLRQNPSKAAVLEEFLHGTQQRLGIIDKLGTAGAESHVKSFMIRHQKMLGIGAEDARRLQVLKDAGL